VEAGDFSAHIQHASKRESLAEPPGSAWPQHRKGLGSTAGGRVSFEERKAMSCRCGNAADRNPNGPDKISDATELLRFVWIPEVE
jgi:hypothetical protein